MPKPTPASFSLEVEGLTEEALFEFFWKLDPDGKNPVTIKSGSEMDLVKGSLQFSFTQHHPLKLLQAVIEMMGKDLEDNELICFETIKLTTGDEDRDMDVLGFNIHYSQALKCERVHRANARNTKRINMISKEIVNLKSRMSDSSEAVTQAFMKSEILGSAFVHINTQLTELGATPFNPDGLFIPYH